MNLSDHFTLEELTRSDYAVRMGFSNIPGDIERANLQRLCLQILEPLREALGNPIHVSSGYRSPLVNSGIGGAKTSAHCYGRAADIEVDGMTPLEVCQQIKALGLPYDQIIHEFGAWCHVAVAPIGFDPRHEELTATKVAGKTEYQHGLA